MEEGKCSFRRESWWLWSACCWLRTMTAFIGVPARMTASSGLIPTHCFLDLLLRVITNHHRSIRITVLLAIVLSSDCQGSNTCTIWTPTNTEQPSIPLRVNPSLLFSLAPFPSARQPHPPFLSTLIRWARRGKPQSPNTCLSVCTPPTRSSSLLTIVFPVVAAVRERTTRSSKGRVGFISLRHEFTTARHIVTLTPTYPLAPNRPRAKHRPSQLTTPVLGSLRRCYPR